MNKSTVSITAYVVLLIVLAALMPWRAVSSTEFAIRSMLAVAVAVVSSVVTRYGLELLLGRAASETSRVSAQSNIRLGFATIGLWQIVKYGLGISLAIDIVSILASTDHIITPVVAFFGAVTLQQLTALVAELLIMAKLESKKRLSRVLALAAVIVVATVFARAANIVYVAQRPPVQPLLSDSTNLLFAIPALLMGVIGILRGVLVKRK